MKDLKTDLVKIFDEEKGLLSALVLNLVLSLVLLVTSIVKIATSSAVVKVGYSDLGGYKNGRAVDLLVFVILALIFGILHDVLAVKIFHKRGRVMSLFFLIVSFMLNLCAFYVLMRLTV